jgi:hypothetical protein
MRKIHHEDETHLSERVRIAEDSKVIRSLGAWIGNDTNDLTPWETIIGKTHKNLERWKKMHPMIEFVGPVF